MSASNESTTKPVVYIVDDDATVLRALARLLRSAGHEVETFPSAEAFLALQPAPEDGALLLDVCMPATSGPELQERLLQRGSRLRVHFMSALDDAHVREAVLARGARSWFTKPLDAEELLAALSQPAKARGAAG